MAKVDLRSWGLIGLIEGNAKKAKDACKNRAKQNTGYEYIAVKKEGGGTVKESYLIYGRLKKAVYAKSV